MWPGRPWEFFQNIAPIAVCYAGSVTYHTMMAHHEKYQTWITLDVRLQTCNMVWWHMCTWHSALETEHAHASCNAVVCATVLQRQLLVVCIALDEWVSRQQRHVHANIGLIMVFGPQVCGIFVLFLGGAQVLMW